MSETISNATKRSSLLPQSGDSHSQSDRCGTASRVGFPN
jgi:hypothetical protein